VPPRLLHRPPLTMAGSTAVFAFAVPTSQLGELPLLDDASGEVLAPAALADPGSTFPPLAFAQGPIALEGAWRGDVEVHVLLASGAAAAVSAGPPDSTVQWEPAPGGRYVAKALQTGPYRLWARAVHTASGRSSGARGLGG